MIHTIFVVNISGYLQAPAKKVSHIFAATSCLRSITEHRLLVLFLMPFLRRNRRLSIVRFFFFKKSEEASENSLKGWRPRRDPALHFIFSPLFDQRFPREAFFHRRSAERRFFHISKMEVLTMQCLLCPSLVFSTELLTLSMIILDNALKRSSFKKLLLSTR